jgi:hypothetical protein
MYRVRELLPQSLDGVRQGRMRVRKDRVDFLIGVFPLTVMRLATRLMYGPESQPTMRAGGCVRNGQSGVEFDAVGIDCRLFSLDLGAACLLTVCCTCSKYPLFRSTRKRDHPANRCIRSVPYPLPVILLGWNRFREGLPLTLARCNEIITGLPPQGRLRPGVH